jgi:flagellar hook-length control protein FliK
LAQTTFAAKASESLSIPQPDTPHAAILAGDTTPNSGSNTPDSGSNTPTPTSALTATGTASAKATSADQPPSITSTLNSPNWSKDFGSRVVWLAKNDQQVAHININPPQLGPVQISISLNGDQANTVFTSPHAEVRQAIQDSLPQLREMFSAAGISLGQANVGSQLPSQNREAAFQFANEARGAGENAILSPDSHASSSPAGIPIQRGRGLVDLFA